MEKPKNSINIRSLNRIFKLFPEIKLVYLFGSQVSGKKGPLSDYDFALYLDEKEEKKMFEIKINLITQLSDILKTDKIDVVILNTVESPELKYNIIKEGKLIYQKEPFKVFLEPKILNEYFDFRLSLLKYKLTKA
jgi:predicted nucleotidyltransferase